MDIIHFSNEDSDRFICCDLRILPGTAMPALHYILARFQLARYTPEHYSQYGIDFPLDIRNSVPKRQAEFIAGRVCAQASLQLYGHPNYRVSSGSHREPVWPPGFVGSITHSGKYAAALVSPDCALMGMGIDIEAIVRSQDRQALEALVVSAEEVVYLTANCGELSYECLLTLVFSAKESFFKAAFAYVQRYFGFDALRVEHIDRERRIICLRAVFALCEGFPEGRLYRAAYEFIENSSILTVVLLSRDN
jgi:enterobactin synthetase component D